MKLLKDILYRSRIEEVIGRTDINISSICFDSRKVVDGCAFVAINGIHVDGHQYINQAIQQGAVAVICEKLPQKQQEGIVFIKVASSSEALGWIASNYFDNPSKKLSLIGVTGTNGKTTIATLLFELFKGFGLRVGLLSTVINKIGDKEIKTTHTTPDPIEINRLLSQMIEQGCTHCFMEVSSHAVHQQRIKGLIFKGAIFTNITHDHLDYHGSFDNYIQAKQKFFDNLPSDAFAIINKDDIHGNIISQNCKANKFTYSIRSAADYTCKILENQFSGLQLNIDGLDVWTKLVGRFNASNLLAIYAVARQMNYESIDALTGISNLSPVKGRFQYIKSQSGIIAIIDYAHTPDALNNVLSTIKEIRTGNEKIITVIGCGGDRDKAKRPLMAEIATTGSDQVILTSDNPRSEDPEMIIKDMLTGLKADARKKIIEISSRKEAINASCAIARSGDIILIAGKGHEKYQEINGIRYPFDDTDIVKSIFQMQNQ